MEYRVINSDLNDVVKPLVEGMGFEIVELSVHSSGTILKIELVIFSESGVSVDDCSKIYRALFDRIEILFEGADLYLEVSSPGISRKLKYYEEFSIFLGRNVKILTHGSSEWVSGKIASVNDEVVSLESDDKIDISFSKISKAKLF